LYYCPHVFAERALLVSEETKMATFERRPSRNPNLFGILGSSLQSKSRASSSSGTRQPTASSPERPKTTGSSPSKSPVSTPLHTSDAPSPTSQTNNTSLVDNSLPAIAAPNPQGILKRYLYSLRVALMMLQSGYCFPWEAGGEWSREGQICRWD
jgi:hypothetical protein